MSGYDYDAVVDERSKLFAYWLNYEAERDARLDGYAKVFCKVYDDIAAGLPVVDVEAELLYGVIRGFAKAAGYLAEYEGDPKLYLTHYVMSVKEEMTGVAVARRAFLDGIVGVDK